MAESPYAGETLAPPDVATRPILLTVAGGLAFLALAMAGFAVLYVYDGPARSPASPQQFPSPRLEPDDSRAERDQLIAVQRDRLARYGWANSGHTLLTIPIERAMDLVVQKGAKAYDPIAGAPPSATGPKP